MHPKNKCLRARIADAMGVLYRDLRFATTFQCVDTTISLQYINIPYSAKTHQRCLRSVSRALVAYPCENIGPVNIVWIWRKRHHGERFELATRCWQSIIRSIRPKVEVHCPTRSTVWSWDSDVSFHGPVESAGHGEVER